MTYGLYDLQPVIEKRFKDQGLDPTAIFSSSTIYVCDLLAKIITDFYPDDYDRRRATAIVVAEAFLCCPVLKLKEDFIVTEVKSRRLIND